MSTQQIANAISNLAYELAMDRVHRQLYEGRRWTMDSLAQANNLTDEVKSALEAMDSKAQANLAEAVEELKRRYGRGQGENS